SDSCRTAARGRRRNSRHDSIANDRRPSLAVKFVSGDESVKSERQKPEPPGVLMNLGRGVSRPWLCSVTKRQELRFAGAISSSRARLVDETFRSQSCAVSCESTHSIRYLRTSAYHVASTAAMIARTGLFSGGIRPGPEPSATSRSRSSTQSDRQRHQKPSEDDHREPGPPR